MRSQPLTEVNNDITRKLLNESGVCSKSIRKYVLTLVPLVEKKIAAKFPEKMRIMFDGWSECRTHFVAVFATYKIGKDTKETLIALSPLEKEDN